MLVKIIFKAVLSSIIPTLLLIFPDKLLKLLFGWQVEGEFEPSKFLVVVIRGVCLFILICIVLYLISLIALSIAAK